MEKFIPTYTDISEWDVRVYQSTGGTRSKKIAIHPIDNTEYFFKGSKVVLDTNEIKYPTEFWSEIASSKIGQLLGFNMLDYNIAYMASDFQKIGCLSASMIEHSQNRLTEGVLYLTGHDPSYRPNLSEHKPLYTIQFITEALKYHGLESEIDNIIEIIIFDSIVGNSDRHQENWGVISYFKETIDEIDRKLENEKIGRFEKFGMHLKKFLNTGFSEFHKSNSKFLSSIIKLQSDFVKQEFAPIYDSGCCLGRELEDEKVKKILQDDQMLNAYINRGSSEVHLKGNTSKPNHFELINFIKTNNKKKVEQVIDRVNSQNTNGELKNIIFNIDKNLPENLSNFKLSDFRKELMYKIVTLRLKKLSEF